MEEIFFRAGALVDPAIRFFIALVGAAAVLFLAIRAVPIRSALGTTRYQRFVQPSKDTSTPAISRHLIMVSKSIAEDKSSDEDILQRFILATAICFITVYLGYGYVTDLLKPHTFQLGNLFDRWLWINALLAAALPYCILRIKLHQVRVRNSYDLVPAVNLLILKYAHYRGNLYYAILDCCKELKGDIQYAFLALLPALQGSPNVTIDDALKLFVFRIGTTWSVQLSVLLHKSEVQGDNIEKGLNWLITDMSQVTQITEESKVESRETVQMGYFPILLLPLVVVLNQFPSQGKSWYYYFQNPMGLRVLIFTVLFCSICALVAFVIRRPRNEV